MAASAAQGAVSVQPWWRRRNSYILGMFRFAFTPGESVPETGVYWVYHYAHRISHPARLLRGERFPECHECGERVRFEPAVESGVDKAQSIRTYNDFKEAA